MSNINYSEKLITLRSKLEISQEELASRLNVSFATVNRWENGKAKPQKAIRQTIDRMIMDVDDSTLESMASVGTRKKRGVQKSQVLSTRSMEQMLWSAACSIRGEKDAPKFKDYLLPLIFIKRLSDVFEDEVNRLAETYGDKKIALKVLVADHTLVRFYIPPEARWPVVSGRESFDWPKDKKPKTLGEQVTLTIRSIVKQNPSLSGVIDIVDYNETRNGEREISDSALRGIIETFSDPRYRLGLHDVEPDFLGRAYEYLLRKFAESQGQSAGEFFTPTEVGFLMARILRPRPGEECYDYACGSAGLLIKLQLTLKERNPLNKIPLTLHGQELTGTSYAIAYMNMIIHDMQGKILRGNSMENPKFTDANSRLKRFDIVVANPMWNQPFDPANYEKDVYGRFEEQGGTTTSKGDWAWLQHTIATLKDNGRAAVVLDTGAVTRGSGSKNEDKEKKIRKWFVDQDLIEGVILLPDNLFYNTSAAGIIIVLNKNKHIAQKNKIILVNASQVFEKGAPKNFIHEDGVKKIVDAFIKGESVDNFVSVITTVQAVEKDYNLSPSSFISLEGKETLRSLPEITQTLKSLEIEASKKNSELFNILSQLEM